MIPAPRQDSTMTERTNKAWGKKSGRGLKQGTGSRWNKPKPSRCTQNCPSRLIQLNGPSPEGRFDGMTVHRHSEDGRAATSGSRGGQSSKRGGFALLWQHEAQNVALWIPTHLQSRQKSLQFNSLE
eukprot:3871984-Amphidinium_carterae.4